MKAFRFLTRWVKVKYLLPLVPLMVVYIGYSLWKSTSSQMGLAIGCGIFGLLAGVYAERRHLRRNQAERDRTLLARGSSPNRAEAIWKSTVGMRLPLWAVILFLIAVGYAGLQLIGLV